MGSLTADLTRRITHVVLNTTNPLESVADWALVLVDRHVCNSEIDPYLDSAKALCLYTQEWTNELLLDYASEQYREHNSLEEVNTPIRNGLFQ